MAALVHLLDAAGEQYDNASLHNDLGFIFVSV